MSRTAKPSPATGPRLTRRAFAGAGAAAVAGAVLPAVPALATGSSAASDEADALGLLDSLKQKLQAVMDAADRMRGQVAQGAFDQAAQSARDMAAAAHDLKDATSGPLWSVGELVPVYGTDVKAARSLTDALATLSDDAVVPVMDALAANPPSSLVSSQDGAFAVDLARLQPLLDAVSKALPSVEDAVQTIDGIGELHVDQLEEGVAKAQDAVRSYHYRLDALGQLVGVVPRLLGSEGPRRYLVVAQSNVEIRSTGGFPGAAGLVSAEGGVVSIGDFSSAYDLMPWMFDDPLPITDEERTIFTDRVANIPEDSNFIPHFPRAAELWSQACATSSGVDVDGIVAIDPVLLQGVVGALGTVPMSDGTVLDGTNTARMLLHEVYVTYATDGEAQDAYFAEAARGAMGLLADHLGDADWGALVGVLADGVRARRLNLWMAAREEQAAVEGLGCAGALQGDKAHPEVGVFVSNDTYGKIDWWLQIGYEWGQASSGKDGSQVVPLRVTFTNTMTDEEAGGLVDYIAGHNEIKRSRGDMVTCVYLTAPLGGILDGAAAEAGTLSGYQAELATSPYGPHQVTYTRIQLLPGESLTISFDAKVPAGAEEALRVDQTPLAQ